MAHSSGDGGVRQLDVPIVIYGFDRPDYLDRLCAGLLAQRGVRPDPARVHLLADGAVSARTGCVHGAPARIAASIAAFRRHFPEGTVHAAPRNLGIADNILRGQRLVFETLDQPTGYFFEDDLEPGPHYLAALEAVRERTGPHAARVAYFAAYGEPRLAVAGPEVGYVRLGHHWGYGLRREAWRRVQDWLAPWWAAIRENDYPARNKPRLLALWRDREVASEGVGEDAATALACADLGLVRVNTDVCFARYIGEEGEHFTPQIFRRLGFAETAVATGEESDFRFPPIAADWIAATAEETRENRRRFRKTGLEPLIERLRAEQEDPDRLATAEEVATLWRLLLDRRVVPPAVLERHAGRSTIRALRREIVRMRAFRRATGV